MPQTTRRGLAPKQAAVYLGVSEQTLRKQRSTGPRPRGMPVVPFVRVGRRILYIIEDLDRWLESHRLAPETAH